MSKSGEKLLRLTVGFTYLQKNAEIDLVSMKST